jgi:hypothetical protein
MLTSNRLYLLGAKRKDSNTILCVVVVYSIGVHLYIYIFYVKSIHFKLCATEAIYVIYLQ